MFFKIEDLVCSNCGKKLIEGDKIFVSLTLPSERRMPVGILDKVIQKHSNYVYCQKCMSEYNVE